MAITRLDSDIAAGAAGHTLALNNGSAWKLAVAGYMRDANSNGGAHSATIGGQSMPNVAAATTDGSSGRWASSYENLDGGASGAVDVVTTHAFGGAAAICYTADGGFQRIAEGVNYGSDDPGNDLQAVIPDTVSGDLVVAMVNINNADVQFITSSDATIVESVTEGSVAAAYILLELICVGGTETVTVSSTDGDASIVWLRYRETASSFALDSDPSQLQRGAATNVQVNDASTTGLLVGDFTATLAGESLTISNFSEIGGGSYSFDVTPPSNIGLQHSSVGYTLRITEGGFNADSSGPVPFLPATGKNFTNLAGTLVASVQWTSGRNYGVAYGNGNGVTVGDIITNAGESYLVEETGTLGATAPTHTGGTRNSTSGVQLCHLDGLTGSNIAEVFQGGYIYGRTTSVTNSTTTPADGVDGWSEVRPSGSLLDGFTQDKPIAGDQAVYDNTTDPSNIAVTVDPNGVWELITPPTVDQTVDVYVIQADGTLSNTRVATYSAGEADTTPDQFSFTAQTGVPVSTQVVSNEITVQGITADAPISIIGGEYAVNLGAGWGGYTSSASTVPNGALVRVRQTSSASFSTTTTATLTIGGVSADFDVTTLDEDTTPNTFSFVSQTGVPIDTEIQSNTITVSGINSAAAISISSAVSATYSINGGGQTASAGTVNNGDTVVVYLLSSSNFSTQSTATLTIGGVSATFSITTQGSPTQTNNPPVISGQAFSVLETAAIGTTIATITATDPDNDTLAYTIVSGNSSGDLALDPNTGVLTVANPLSYSVAPTYSIVIEVTDGIAIRSATFTVNVIPAVGDQLDVVNLSVFFPEVRTEIPTVSDVLLRWQARSAIIDFCQRTWYWQEDLPSLTLDASVDTYRLVPSAGRQIADITKVQIPDSNGDLQQVYRGARADRTWHFTQPAPHIIQFSTISEMAPGPAKIKVALQPDRTSSDVAESIYQRQYETIILGIKAKLYAMVGQSWFNQNIAGAYQNAFENACEDARLEVARDYSNQPDSTARPARLFY